MDKKSDQVMRGESNNFSSPEDVNEHICCYFQLTSETTFSPFKKKKVGTLLTPNLLALSGNASISILTKVIER